MQNPVIPEQSQQKLGIKEDLNTFVEMRDGVKIACDIYRPDAEGTFPALLAMSPYGKEGQRQPIPPAPFGGEYAHLEIGDTDYLISRGYAHVVIDVRGSGHSEGQFDVFSPKQAEDGYDLVEWVAAQPWCDGNVGMIGISYYAIIQYLVAAQQPPHLKAIFPHDGFTDMYRHVARHGGILMHGWLRVWAEGGNMPVWNNRPVAESLYSEEELEKMVDRWKSNPLIKLCPTLYNTLEYRQYKPTVFDYLVNEFDGPYWQERSAANKLDKIKVPVFLGTEFHDYPVVMHQLGATEGWENIDAPKRMVIRPSVPERPFHEFHDEIIDWYDYWMKGVDNGIMDEPPIKIWVRGKEAWRNDDQWPLAGTRWTDYYLREGNRLAAGEKPTEDETPDRFDYQPTRPMVLTPFFMDPAPGHVEFATAAMPEDMEVVGPIALYLFASIKTEDADFIVKLLDIDPDGHAFVLSRGWLKASHRELDSEKSKPWQPYHPHTRAVPVKPGEVNEYAIEIRPIANLFRKGHRIRLEIWPCDYPVEPFDMTLLYPLWSHLAHEKETSYEIHHSAQYPSRLVLPLMANE